MQSEKMIDFLKTLGEYSPYFMYIKLETDKPDTMIHEYIHYIQNVTTNFGMEQYSFYRKALAMLIIHNTRGENLFVEPQFIESRDIFRSNFAKRMGIPYRNAEIKDIKFNDNKTIKSKYGKRIVSTANVYLLLDGTPVDYVFNVTTIKENMARLIQNHCFPIEKTTKILDYDICESIISKYKPNFPITVQNIVALCDLSLLSEFPVHTFFLMLSAFPSNFTPKHPREIYDYIKESTGYTSSDGKEYTFEHSYNEKLNECFEGIENLYSKNDIISSVNGWLKNTFSVAKEFRKNNPYFIIDILDNSEKQAQEKIVSYMYVLDVPLTIKPDNEAFSGSINENSEYLLLLRAEQEIFNCLNKGKRIYECGMKDICEKTHMKK